MKPLKYDHTIWQRIKADRDLALANPSAPRPNWMIGRPSSLTAFMQGYPYVVYRKSVPLRPFSYGSSADVDISISPFARVMLDMTEYALARRPWFVTGQGCIRAVSFSDIIDTILALKRSIVPTTPPPQGQFS